MSIQGPGNTSGLPQQVKLDGNGEEKQQKAKTVETEKKVSLFSHYDANKNKSVNYGEAHSNSLFDAARTADFSSMGSSDAAKKIAVNKFNPGVMFENMLQKFNAKVGSKEITYVTDIEGKTTIKGGKNEDVSELDAKAQNAASAAAQRAAEVVKEAYQEALAEAEKELAANANAANELGDIDPNSLKLKGGVEKADLLLQDQEAGEAELKEKYTNQQTETIKTKVYSNYDQNADEKVINGEGNIQFGYEQSNFTTIFPTGFGDSGTANDMGAIVNIAGYDYQAAFNQEVSNFSVKSGSETLKFDGEVDQAAMDAAAQKLDKKVDDAIAKASKSATNKVQKEYQQKLNEAYDKFLMDPEQAKVDYEAKKAAEALKQQQEEAPIVAKKGDPNALQYLGDVDGVPEFKGEDLSEVVVTAPRLHATPVSAVGAGDDEVSVETGTEEVTTPQTTAYNVKAGDSRGIYGIVQGSYSRTDGKPMTHQNIMALVRDIQNSNNIDKSVGIKSNMNLPNEFDLGGGVKAKLGESIQTKTDTPDEIHVTEAPAEEVTETPITPLNPQEVTSTAQGLYNYVDNNSGDTGIKYMHNSIVNNNSVNADNVVEVMEEYEKQSGGESIVESMTSEWLSTGDSADKPSGRKMAFDTAKDLVGKLLERADRAGIDKNNRHYDKAQRFVKYDAFDLGNVTKNSYITNKNGGYDSDLHVATKKFIKGLLAEIKKAETEAQA